MKCHAAINRTSFATSDTSCLLWMLNIILIFNNNSWTNLINKNFKMPEFSLFSLFSKYLDPHLTFPLLEFMADRNVSEISYSADIFVDNLLRELFSEIKDVYIYPVFLWFLFKFIAIDVFSVINVYITSLNSPIIKNRYWRMFLVIDHFSDLSQRHPQQRVFKYCEEDQLDRLHRWHSEKIKFGFRNTRRIESKASAGFSYFTRLKCGIWTNYESHRLDGWFR